MANPHPGPGRPFVKGQSGNPSGKSKTPNNVQEFARQYTVDAVEALAAALRSPRERVAAAIALLDRGWGKPKELVKAVNLNIDAGGIDKPPRPETLDEWLARRRGELAELCAPESSDKPH